ncbi:uncharacterized protein [Solanum tuberosum]|uniref:uncharacterized protein n=1 Tax=Solanum tuberosum TaxID=4113 RepID=UPI00073A35CA|nr:PREDICTED: uncharacterized protein LOC107060720 [Solanum tuberosum]
MALFQTNVRFLGHNIERGNISPINRSIEFASKFPDILTNKTQLQRFLGSFNYVAPFIKDLAKDTAIVYERLKTNPKAWSYKHIEAVKKIKTKVKTFCVLLWPTQIEKTTVETDASDIGYRGILTQYCPDNKGHSIIQFCSGKWNDAQKNYVTIAKEILEIVKSVLKFQGDL